MDYLTFIDDISKIWNEKDNSKICKDYSLNRSVLPALIKLNREWQEVFDDLSNDYNKLELELNNYKSNKDLVNIVELEKKLIELRNEITELEEDCYQKDKEIRVLKQENYNLRNSSIFKKLVG